MNDQEVITHSPGPWYAQTINKGSAHEQGLIISEVTSRNIAVTYDPKDAKIVAAAPDLLKAAKGALRLLYDSVNYDERDPETLASCRELYAAISKTED